MDPRKKCLIVLEDEAQSRRIQRGLTKDVLERVVRDGIWNTRPDGYDDVKYGVWTARVKLGKCTISVTTVFPERKSDYGR